jgi:hypothetical protein
MKLLRLRLSIRNLWNSPLKYANCTTSFYKCSLFSELWYFKFDLFSRAKMRRPRGFREAQSNIGLLCLIIIEHKQLDSDNNTQIRVLLQYGPLHISYIFIFFLGGLRAFRPFAQINQTISFVVCRNPTSLRSISEHSVWHTVHMISAVFPVFLSVF